MAISKLTLYNNALVLLGQRVLSSDTEDQPHRYFLDNAYTDLSANQYCLELTKPVFSRKTTKLSTSSTPTESGYLYQFALPSDYIGMVQAFSDDKLDQPINRYIIEGSNIICDYSPVYLRFVSDDHVTSFTSWDESFARVVSAYLAKEIAMKVAPNCMEIMTALFNERVASVMELNKVNEPAFRPSKATSTLTNDWLNIYNDALLIMGLPKITSNNDDSYRRSQIDAALSSTLIEELLEDTGWTFGLTSTKMQYDPSVEPAWGYRRAFQKPADLERISGLYYDEYMDAPLKRYLDEGDYFFADEDEIYFQYVSTNYQSTVSSWPAFFKRLVAARLAKDSAMSLRAEGADPVVAALEFEDRESKAKANDAMAAPPRKLTNGNWVSSRFRGTDRNRP